MTISNKIANYTIILTGIVALLIYAKDILLPFVMAIFVWLIIRSVRNYLLKIKLIDKYIPTWALNIIATLIIFGIVFAFGALLVENLEELTEVVPKYQENLNNIIAQFNQALGIDLSQEVKNFVSNIDVSSFLQVALSSFSGFLSTFLLVLIYVLFLLLEEKTLGEKIKMLFKNDNENTKAKKVMQKLSDSIESYLFIKSVIAILSSALSYIALVSFGIDFALFWAFLIFVTSYIPNIGAYIGGAFPALFALFQTNSLEVFLAIAVIFAVIQFVTGNILEPKWMGKSMNLSALVVILALAAWGVIWGIVGMILSVPLTMIINIILSQFPSTQKVSIMLSEKGEVK
ncbi:AI-2E family transporter [Candidatus Peregrinibacteria bacterium]|nr:AI-2E family transporter [Candidatus Peregrinibacteria bacterium]